MKKHATIDDGKAMKANAGLRGLSAVLGGTLLLASLRRRGLTGAGLAMLGGGLLLGAAIGSTPAREIAGDVTKQDDMLMEDPVPPVRVLVFDVVQEASEESFPASDPPGWY